jgi:hypothetical protein
MNTSPWSPPTMALCRRALMAALTAPWVNRSSGLISTSTSVQEVDPSILGKRLGKRPAPEGVQGVEPGGDPQLAEVADLVG